MVSIINGVAMIEHVHHGTETNASAPQNRPFDPAGFPRLLRHPANMKGYRLRDSAALRRARRMRLESRVVGSLITTVMATINQVRQQIRFALDQLSARNRFHEFEHLCRDLARKRICSNILPATGPVQARGDQGRDFETFRTYLAGSSIAESSFVGLATGKALVFCCSLQKSVKSKIKYDVETVARPGTKLDGVYYFCSEDVPIATRHELQDWAQLEWTCTWRYLMVRLYPSSLLNLTCSTSLSST